MDYSTVNFILLSTGALIAILNPIGILPQYINFTDELSEKELKQTTRRAVLTSGLILITVSLIGTLTLQFFNITISAFKVAGGIILFKISLDMLYVRITRLVTSRKEFEEGMAKEDVSIFPLAIPLIAGPGSITTVIMLGDEATTAVEHFFLLLCLIIIALGLYLILLQAKRINEFLGQIGVNVMTRLMGLILAAIAIQFIMDGTGQMINQYINLNLELHRFLGSAQN